MTRGTVMTSRMIRQTANLKIHRNQINVLNHSKLLIIDVIRRASYAMLTPASQNRRGIA